MTERLEKEFSLPYFEFVNDESDTTNCIVKKSKNLI